MKTYAIVRPICMGASVLTVLLLSFIAVESLILSFPKWWYRNQQRTAERICREIRLGMTRDAVRQFVDSRSNPHGESEDDHILQFWTTGGTCSVSFAMGTDQVVTTTYDRERGRFTGIE